MTEKLKVKDWERTCIACPSQWDIYTDTGRYIYVRFRHGDFSACLDEVFGETLFEWSSDDMYDGCMTDEEMMNMLSDYLDFSNAMKNGIE